MSLFLNSWQIHRLDSLGSSTSIQQSSARSRKHEAHLGYRRERMSVSVSVSEPSLRHPDARRRCPRPMLASKCFVFLSLAT